MLIRNMLSNRLVELRLRFSSVPGEAGRHLVQRYFEAEHSATAIIHPKTELMTVTPDRRYKRSTPQSASNSSRPGLRRFAPHSAAPAQSLRPAYRSPFGQAVPAYPGHATMNRRTPSVPLFNGNVMNSSGHSTTSAIYRQGSFPFR